MVLGYTAILTLLWWSLNRPDKRTFKRWGVMWIIGIVIVLGILTILSLLITGWLRYPI